MRTFSAREAAELLHLNVKRVQSLAREGRLPAVRVGRKWLFQQAALEKLLGSAPPSSPISIEISARNRLNGKIVHLQVDGLMAEVHLQIGEQNLVSVITRAAAEAMGLKVGDPAFAVIKSTEVMIGKEG